MFQVHRAPSKAPTRRSRVLSSNSGMGGRVLLLRVALPLAVSAEGDLVAARGTADPDAVLLVRLLLRAGQALVAARIAGVPVVGVLPVGLFVPGVPGIHGLVPVQAIPVFTTVRPLAPVLAVLVRPGVLPAIQLLGRVQAIGRVQPAARGRTPGRPREYQEDRPVPHGPPPPLHDASMGEEPKPSMLTCAPTAQTAARRRGTAGCRRPSRGGGG
jgi:hypothetical protein